MNDELDNEIERLEREDRLKIFLAVYFCALWMLWAVVSVWVVFERAYG